MVARAVLEQLASSQKSLRQPGNLQSSAHSMMESGVGRGLSSDAVARIPENPCSMGATVRKGAIDRVPGARRTGNQAQWETSSMAANVQARACLVLAAPFCRALSAHTPCCRCTARRRPSCDAACAVCELLWGGRCQGVLSSDALVSRIG
jgi:hypothetical protein